MQICRQRSLLTVLGCVFFYCVASTGMAQDSGAVAGTRSPGPSGFEWLRQFEGSWKTVSKSNATSQQPSSTINATLESRCLGDKWVINEHAADFFQAVQTLGYDGKKQVFVGRWVDSLMDHTWHYTGKLDKSGKKLVLNTSGPDMSDPTVNRLYRDSYRFISRDEIEATSEMKNDDGQWQIIMTSTITRVKPEPVDLAKSKETTIHPKSKSASGETSITPFLMFTGQAEKAIELYKTVFADTRVLDIKRYQEGGVGVKGAIEAATISVQGQQIRLFDSPMIHNFDFTPSISFFVECESKEQLDKRFAQLSAGGKVMMPLDNYGFSKRFGWTSDKFGVSWQLNLKD